MWSKEAGQKFKEMREKAGYTQETLAKTMGYNSNTISLVERGVISPSPKFRERALRAIRRRLRWIELKDLFLDSVNDTSHILNLKRVRSKNRPEAKSVGANPKDDKSMDNSLSPTPKKSPEKSSHCVLGGKSG